MTNEITEAARRYEKAFRSALGEGLIKFLDDPDVVEVLANPDGRVFVDTLSKGQVETELKLTAGQRHKIIALVLHESSIPVTSISIASEFPFQHARFQANLPPLTEEPLFSIRKHMIASKTLDEYVKDKELSENYYQKICKAIIEHKNILVVGGTSSGKTTFLRAVLERMAEFNPHERFLIIEDTREIRIKNARNLVSLLTWFDEVEEKSITQTRLLKDTLRLRPDRIIIGELRDGVAFDFIKAMNTGHDGCASTIHASSAKEGLDRLLLLAHETPYELGGMVEYLKETIGNSVDIVIFLEKKILSDGRPKRYVKDVLSVAGYDVKSKKYMVEA